MDNCNIPGDSISEVLFLYILNVRLKIGVVFMALSAIIKSKIRSLPLVATTNLQSKTATQAWVSKTAKNTATSSLSAVDSILCKDFDELLKIDDFSPVT